MRKIWILPLIVLLSACLAPGSTLSTPEPSVEDTATSVPTETPTVVWFPPTDVPAITPTQIVTPTPGVMAELGEVIFRDEFNSPENWTLPSSDRGQINISGGEINIIINEPGSYFAAILEKPDLGDFYAEIKANPVLCNTQDEYGFLFRVRGLEQYYRFGLTCGGEVRLDRIFPGGSAVLSPWTRSASVPAGAPSVSKLAVLAVDDQIFLYINGDPQYSAENQSINVGSFGVYSRSVGGTAVTVSFSDLVVREVLPK
jgi:hypothetical protein